MRVEDGEVVPDDGAALSGCRGWGSLLCGLVGKIVAWLEENYKRLWCDEFGMAGVGCGLA